MSPGSTSLNGSQAGVVTVAVAVPVATVVLVAATVPVLEAVAVGVYV